MATAVRCGTGPAFEGGDRVHFSAERDRSGYRQLSEAADLTRAGANPATGHLRELATELQLGQKESSKSSGVP
jgi:hypothetical protein